MAIKCVFRVKKNAWTRNHAFLVIPCLERDEAKKWNGDGYDAIVLINNSRNTIPKDEIDFLDVETVAKRTLFLSKDKSSEKKADFDDVEKAATLLTWYTRAIDYAQTKEKPKEITGKYKTDYIPK